MLESLHPSDRHEQAARDQAQHGPGEHEGPPRIIRAHPSLHPDCDERDHARNYATLPDRSTKMPQEFVSMVRAEVILYEPIRGVPQIVRIGTFNLGRPRRASEGREQFL
jgi:hypothetical protein